MVRPDTETGDAMRAAQVQALGQPPALVDLPSPTPGAGEVLVEIAACGLNFADGLMVAGTYQDTPPLPFTLGMECAGTVVALGDGVEGLEVGTRVACMGGSGGLAEEGVFPANRCLPIPETMSFVEAAAFQVAYGTSHVALTYKAALKPGETLVVTGAAGGVGLTAVEIGVKLGANVIAVARGEDKLAVAKTAGAHHLIEATSEDIRGQLKALGGADVVYDAVGGDLFRACFRAARPEARIIVIGFASGDVPKVPANHLLVKNLSLLGFYWGGYMGFKPQVITDSLAELLRWYEDGNLKPHVSSVLPLDRLTEGLSLLRTRRSTGKVVIETRA